MKKLYILLLTCFLSTVVFSQIDDLDDPGSSVPVDGGIVTITLLAAAYGAKRRQEKKDKEDQTGDPF